MLVDGEQIGMLQTTDSFGEIGCASDPHTLRERGGRAVCQRWGGVRCPLLPRNISLPENMFLEVFRKALVKRSACCRPPTLSARSGASALLPKHFTSKIVFSSPENQIVPDVRNPTDLFGEIGSAA